MTTHKLELGSWRRIKANSALIEQTPLCIVCQGIIDEGLTVYCYYDPKTNIKYAIHRSSSHLGETVCASIFIGAFVKNYLAALGVNRGDDGVQTSLDELSSIFHLSTRQLNRLCTAFERSLYIPNGNNHPSEGSNGNPA